MLAGVAVDLKVLPLGLLAFVDSHHLELVSRGLDSVADLEVEERADVDVLSNQNDPPLAWLDLKVKLLAFLRLTELSMLKSRKLRHLLVGSRRSIVRTLVLSQYAVVAEVRVANGPCDVGDFALVWLEQVGCLFEHQVEGSSNEV